jgi:hypothetical protein
MLVKGEKRRNTDVSTPGPGDPYPPGLRILARMIARYYLEEKQAQCLQKEKRSGIYLMRDALNSESWEGSDDE